MAAYKSLQEERAAAQHQKHLVFADETAWLMVGFAERAIKYRQETDGAKVPKAQHRWAKPPYRCCSHKMSPSFVCFHCSWAVVLQHVQYFQPTLSLLHEGLGL